MCSAVVSSGNERLCHPETAEASIHGWGCALLCRHSKSVSIICMLHPATRSQETTVTWTKEVECLLEVST